VNVVVAQWLRAGSYGLFGGSGVAAVVSTVQFGQFNVAGGLLCALAGLMFYVLSEVWS
jgi:hypothetical protein